MSKYYYRALKNNNQIVKGEIEASNHRDAREKIRELGYLPTKIYTEVSEEEKSVDNSLHVSHVTESSNVSFLSLGEKIMFTSELQVLLSSGISILDALESIELNSPKHKIKTICSNLKLSIMSGATFAQALSSLYEPVFGPVYIALVKSGENSGELDETLMRMLILLRKQQSIKDNIFSASIYPAILLVLMFVLLLIFSKLVFPAFMSFFAFNGQTLPPLAGLLVGICSFVEHFWWLLIIFAGAISGALMALFKNPEFKSKWDEFILKVPVISDFITYINLSNFMTVLQISYDAGLPIMSGLELANRSVGNYIIKHRISNSVHLVKSGKSLTEAFYQTGAIPNALMTMVATGEKSGTLGKMLHDAADVLDKRVDMALDALTKLFGPTVIVILGGVVLFIAVAFYQMYAGMLSSLF